jgi:hypothetical protein
MASNLETPYIHISVNSQAPRKLPSDENKTWNLTRRFKIKIEFDFRFSQWQV